MRYLLKQGHNWRLIGSDSDGVELLYNTERHHFNLSSTAVEFLRQRIAADFRGLQPGQKIQMPMMDGDNKTYTVTQNSPESVVLTEPETGKQFNMPHIPEGFSPQVIDETNQPSQSTQPNTGQGIQVVRPGTGTVVSLSKNDIRIVVRPTVYPRVIGVNPKRFGDRYEVKWHDGSTELLREDVTPWEIKQTIHEILVGLRENTWDAPVERRVLAKSDVRSAVNLPQTFSGEVQQYDIGDSVQFEEEGELYEGTIADVQYDESGHTQAPTYIVHTRGELHAVPYSYIRPKYSASVRTAQPQPPVSAPGPAQELAIQQDQSQKPVLSPEEVIQESERLIENSLYKGVKIGVWDLVAYMQDEYGNDEEDLLKGGQRAWGNIMYIISMNAKTEHEMKLQQLYNSAEGTGPEQIQPVTSKYLKTPPGGESAPPSPVQQARL